MSVATPPFTTMLRRALVLKCPRCGSRRSHIRRWLGRHERCRTCGIRWHREHGFELGPITLSVVITFFTIAVTMAVGLVLSAPDYEVLPLFLTVVAVAVVVPLFIAPFTNLLWLAFDLATHKPDERERAEADAAVGRTG